MIRKKNRLNLYKNSCRQQNIRRSFIWNFERDFKILLCDRFQNHRFVWRNCGIESRSNIVLEIMINCRRDKELITQQKPGNLLIRKPQNIKLTKLQQFFLMIFWFADKEFLEFPIPLHTSAFIARSCIIFSSPAKWLREMLKAGSLKFHILINDLTLFPLNRNCLLLVNEVVGILHSINMHMRAPYEESGRFLSNEKINRQLWNFWNRSLDHNERPL